MFFHHSGCILFYLMTMYMKKQTWQMTGKKGGFAWWKHWWKDPGGSFSVSNLCWPMNVPWEVNVCQGTRCLLAPSWSNWSESKIWGSEKSDRKWNVWKEAWLPKTNKRCNLRWGRSVLVNSTVLCLGTLELPLAKRKWSDAGVLGSADASTKRKTGSTSPPRENTEQTHEKKQTPKATQTQHHDRAPYDSHN